MVFRIATLNVHCWEDAQGNDNVDRIVKLVRKHNPDVLCIQETIRHLEEIFMVQTDFKIRVNFGSVSILSKFGCREYFESQVEKSRRVIPFVTAKIEVPVEETCLNGNHHISDQTNHTKPLYVTCLHLDHILEPTRQQEMRDMCMAMPNLMADPQARHIWTGDFNALTREDYSEMEWAEVTRIRELGNWELPETEVTTQMKSELGFHDLWAENGSQGSVKTCRFDTRIDYIYTSSSVLKQHQLQWAKHIQDDASDHNMVIAELK